MRKILTLANVGMIAAFGLVAASCGSDTDAGAAPEPTDAAIVEPAATAPAATPGTSAPETTAPAVELPTIVVTTNILGDVVSQVVGDLAAVEVIMPIGADPHDFAPSAKQAESMENADLLVVNGAGFEEGMLPVIEQVESSGTPTFAFTDQIQTIEFTGHSHDHDHGEDEAHADDEAHAEDEAHADEGEHAEEKGSIDAHFWTDPTRMITAVEAFGTELATLEGIDTAALETQVDAYVAELEELDAGMDESLGVVPPEQRVLVTNHEVFEYFAERFGFEVVGAVIPSVTTNAEPSAAEIDELAELIRAEGIPAIFGDTSGSTNLAEALASSVGGDVEIVVLFSESLGEDGSGAETYVGMMETNASLIAGALGPA